MKKLMIRNILLNIFLYGLCLGLGSLINLQPIEPLIIFITILIIILFEFITIIEVIKLLVTKKILYTLKYNNNFIDTYFGIVPSVIIWIVLTLKKIN